MRYFIYLLLIILSCKSNPKETKEISNTIVNVSNTTNDSCIYIQRKQKAQQLKHFLELNPNKSTESAFAKFIIDSLLPCWYGTLWDFNGTTQEPGNGSIACGYFVTTVLQDAGINLNRIKLSQCASEEMIKKLSHKNSIIRFSNQSLAVFDEKIMQKEAGLYIVGLDFHTGFIYHNGEELYFIHASYAAPKIVRKEKVLESGVLAASKYKIIGKVNFNSN